jgi:CHAT domain-containing protein
VTAVPATFLGVHDALASGKFDVLHFSTHSSHAQGMPSQWKLYLEDHEALTPEDLVSAAANLGSKRPLVFLNACQTGLNAETITGVSGWATQFIRAGCGAFIGAYWNLDDRSANLFQATFYGGTNRRRRCTRPPPEPSLIR